MGHAPSTVKNCRDADLFYSGSSDEDKDKERSMVRIKIMMPSADESECSDVSNAETDVSSFRVLNFSSSEDPGERSPTSVSIGSVPHHPHFKCHLSKQVERPCSAHFLPQVFSTLFRFAETFSHHPSDRDAFMAFIESGMWASYLDASVYDSLLSSSGSVGLGTSRPQCSLSPLARQVVESEILTDGSVNMDRARVENCFSADDLRALTLAVLAVCYARYCNDPDGAELPQPGPAQSGTYLSQSFSQYSLGCSLRPWDALPLEPAEDSTFFLDPLNVLRVTVRSTSRREFVLLLSEGDWASKFLPVFHEMELSLTVSEVVRSKCGSVHFPLFYANKHCGAIVHGETGPPVFDLQRQWFSGEEGLDSVAAAWARGLATKSKLRRSSAGGGPAQTVLASCLPVRNGDSQAEYILSIHQPIASALPTSRQQAFLRMGDFLLFCFGTVLAGR